MFTRMSLVLACLLAACQGQSSTSTARIACQTTADCAARGGLCTANECHADNECTSDAECAVGEVCNPDPDFDGLCAAPGSPLAPGPAWACTVGKDCPANQGCASDGMCHVDGECHNTWQQDGTLAGDCTGGLMCAASGPNVLAGYCTDGRGGPDPYCRSTGTGECRSLCAVNDDCGTGGVCTAGFCHGDDECATTADCTPNHICGSPDGWDDYGFGFCLVDPNPTCVPDGAGACRLACASDADCLHGGGCDTDHLCHASNECHSDADCTGLDECYTSPEFGGLCGPPRP
jgi:hypothetical protein